MPNSIVLVTESEFRRGQDVFSTANGLTCVAGPANEEALARAIKETGARHAVVGGQLYHGPLYDALARGSVLARFGVGHEGIDKARATRAGLYCTNTPAVLDQSVAELTFLLVAAAARHLPAIAGAMREGQWAPKLGAELKGKTLVVLGAGRIGRAVGRIARRGFEMRVIGVRRHGSSSSAEPGEDFDAITEDVERRISSASSFQGCRRTRTSSTAPAWRCFVRTSG
jgi:phosphoglycerate dehydrogenase-like enzyme